MLNAEDCFVVIIQCVSGIFHFFIIIFWVFFLLLFFARPTINIARDPRWGRNYETPGEDPLMNGLYGTYFTLGLQNGSETYTNKYYDARYYQTIATLKHYDAYSLETYNSTITRHSFNAIVSDYMLNDTYLPAFETTIKNGGAKGVMCSYNAGMTIADFSVSFPV